MRLAGTTSACDADLCQKTLFLFQNQVYSPSWRWKSSQHDLVWCWTLPNAVGSSSAEFTGIVPSQPTQHRFSDWLVNSQTTKHVFDLLIVVSLRRWGTVAMSCFSVWGGQRTRVSWLGWWKVCHGFPKNKSNAPLLIYSYFVLCRLQTSMYVYRMKICSFNQYILVVNILVCLMSRQFRQTTLLWLCYYVVIHVCSRIVSRYL